MTHTIATNDDTRIYFKDWGTGQPVVFSHGWPLSADAWDDQMLFLGEHGYRVIAHDRRGQTWTRTPTISPRSSGTPTDSEDTLQFSELTGVRPMIERYPLAKAEEAYARMMSGKAEFRAVLTM